MLLLILPKLRLLWMGLSMWLILGIVNWRFITLKLVWMLYRLPLFLRLMLIKEKGGLDVLGLGYAIDCIVIVIIELICWRIIFLKYRELIWLMWFFCWKLWILITCWSLILWTPLLRKLFWILCISCGCWDVWMSWGIWLIWGRRWLSFLWILLWVRCLFKLISWNVLKKFWLLYLCFLFLLFFIDLKEEKKNLMLLEKK